MFLCKPCHKKITCRVREICEMQLNGETQGMGISRGPCEACGKVKNCVDCHG